MILRIIVTAKDMRETPSGHLRVREKPDILNASRKKRVAAGSGTSVEEVNKLLKQFEQINKLMKQFSDPSKLSRFTKGRMKMPF